MTRPPTTWKHTERVVAALLNGQRVPVSGRARGSTPDVAHPRLSIEVKHRAIIPAWILTALVQAVAAAQPGQLPIAVIHAAGTRHDQALVVMRLSDFKKQVQP